MAAAILASGLFTHSSVAAAVARVASHAAATPPGVVWAADGTKGIQNEWASMHTTANCGTTTYAGLTDPHFYLITDPTAPHGVAWRSTFTPSGTTGCYCYPSVCREEVGQGNSGKTFADGVDRLFQEGQDRWLSFEIKMDANTPTGQNALGSALFQFTHPVGDGGPAQDLNINQGQWSFYGVYSNAPGSVAGGQHHVGSVVPGLGKWVKWTIHMVLSSNPNVGGITAWSDLANPGGPMPVVYQNTPAFTMISGRPAFLTFGIYNGNTHPTYSMGEAEAGLTVATNRAAAEANAFGGSVSGPGTQAAFTASPSPSTTGTPVTFDGSTTTCAKTPCTYAYTDANNRKVLGSAATSVFTFHYTGTKRVTLTVTDANGATSSVEHDQVVQ